MKADYEDITSRIPEPPKWWDENGTPRYCEFAPFEAADPYADEVALVEIACQNCFTRFQVAVSEKRLNLQAMMAEKYLGHPRRTLRQCIDDDRVAYGGTPSHGCSGDTMTSYILRVLQFWERGRLDWERVPAVEIVLPDSEDPDVKEFSR